MKSLKYILGVIFVLGFVGFGFNAYAQGTCIPIAEYENQLRDGCTNSPIDDDCDTLIDCDDPDCDYDPACIPLVCEDQSLCLPHKFPDDGTSCRCHLYESPDGWRCETGEITELACRDGLDNDGDGKIDCDDWADCGCACTGCTIIIPDHEISCNDCYDNDRDGAYDCDDTDCIGAPECTAEPTVDEQIDEMEARSVELSETLPTWREDYYNEVKSASGTEVRELGDTVDTSLWPEKSVRVEGDVNMLDMDIRFEAARVVAFTSTNTTKIRDMDGRSDMLISKTLRTDARAMSVLAPDLRLEPGSEYHVEERAYIVGDDARFGGILMAKSIEIGGNRVESKASSDVQAEEVRVSGKRAVNIDGRLSASLGDLEIMAGREAASSAMESTSELIEADFISGPRTKLSAPQGKIEVRVTGNIHMNGHWNAPIVHLYAPSGSLVFVGKTFKSVNLASEYFLNGLPFNPRPNVDPVPVP